MAICGSDATPPVKEMKNSCGEPSNAKATKCIILPLGPSCCVGEGRIQSHHHLINHIWKQEPTSGSCSSWITLRAVHWQCTTQIILCAKWIGGRATRGQWLALHGFASFPLIKNSDSWNTFLSERIFSQTRVHCMRAQCCKKRCRNQWAIRQFHFGNFHHCLHKQS